MLTWKEFKKMWNHFEWSDDLKSTNKSLTYLRRYSNLFSKGYIPNQFCSWWAKNALANEGPYGDPIDTPSI